MICPPRKLRSEIPTTTPTPLREVVVGGIFAHFAHFAPLEVGKVGNVSGDLEGDAR